MNVVGRKEEIEIFENLEKSKSSEFLALYGRRRIGKTYLVKEYYAKKQIFFHQTGMRNAKQREQLKEFAKQFSKTFSRIIPSPESWFAAFELLQEELDKQESEEKIVLFFDELPWLATQRSNFLSALDKFWNNWAVQQNNIILIICGSAASWMIKKVIHHKGGLHNRITQKINLQPFSLQEVKQFLHYRDIHLEENQILELFLTTGGVAEYLNHVHPGQSAAQNISNMCFNKNGFLFDEFEKLFQINPCIL